MTGGKAMANDTIKEFVKRQTTGMTIGVPKSRARAEDSTPHTEATATIGPGRPKSLVEKVKISVYVPAEIKAKLVKIQHNNYKQNLNDVMVEAVDCLLTKYGEK